MGISVYPCRELPFRVGSGRGFVIYLWSVSERIRSDRLWEGIAQCVLTRAGIDWSEQSALTYAAELRTMLPYNSEQKTGS